MTDINSGVIASSVSVYRNLANTPFPIRLSAESKKQIGKKIFAVIQNSRFAGEFDVVGNALVSKDKSINIELCKEEHIELNVYENSDDLQHAFDKASEIDDVLVGNLKIAFNKQYGFLTSNPMNVGTAMICRYILKLPFLVAHNEIASLSNTVSKLGFSLKPDYDYDKYCFELSNNVTLGITEQNSVDNITAICNQIIRLEEMFRKESNV